MARLKMQNQDGFTLVELLAVALLSTLLALIITVGVQVATKSHHDATAGAETQTLSATLSDALADELRFGRNFTFTSTASLPAGTNTEGTPTLAYSPASGAVDIEVGKLVYDSPKYGKNAQVKIQNGQLVIETTQLDALGAPTGSHTVHKILAPALYGYHASADPANTYSVGTYAVNNCSIRYDENTNTFEITVGVKDTTPRSTGEQEVQTKSTFSVQCLNATTNQGITPPSATTTPGPNPPVST